MNTFWLKIAVLAVVVVGLIVLVNVFLSSEREPKPEPKSFYDVVRQDDERLRAEPETRDARIERRRERRPRSERPTERPSRPRRQERVVRQPAEPVEKRFKELSLEDKVRAEKLFEMALFERKKGRLPGIGFKNMVDYCREIIEKWPDSVYAFKARRMLAEVPERFRKRYKITDEEIDLGNLK